MVRRIALMLFQPTKFFAEYDCGVLALYFALVGSALLLGLISDPLIVSEAHGADAAIRDAYGGRPLFIAAVAVPLLLSPLIIGTVSYAGTIWIAAMSGDPSVPFSRVMAVALTGDIVFVFVSLLTVLLMSIGHMNHNAVSLSVVADYLGYARTTKTFFALSLVNIALVWEAVVVGKGLRQLTGSLRGYAVALLAVGFMPLLQWYVY